MSKVICEICGTTYQDTAECCPICGCPRDMSGNVSDDDFVMDQMPALNKGGRYSSGKKKKLLGGAPKAYTTKSKSWICRSKGTKPDRGSSIIQPSQLHFG